MKRTKLLSLVCVATWLAQYAHADFSAEMAAASAPLAAGVPEVAVVRLRALLRPGLPEPQWRAVVEKLAEAQVAAHQPEQTLSLLSDQRLRDFAWAKFWRAQSLAALHRWAEALPLYQELAADPGSPFHQAALFGAAEMLRALGKRNEAARSLGRLFGDKEWAVRAQLRAAELYIEMGDASNAHRLLTQVKPASTLERKERRFLRGRLELLLQRPERAIAMFQLLLKRPQGAAHATLIAALFGIADAEMQRKMPEAGDDFLEQFIDRHPADPDLPAVFAKLDELYRAERKPSRNELEKWVRNPDEPRRSFARWYLARFEIRAGRRERARQLFADLRRSGVKSPTIAAAYLDFAQLQIEDEHFNDALAILEEARRLRPEAPLLAQIEFLSARTLYLAKRFDAATVAFEQIGRSDSPWARVALFNAATGSLQLGDQLRFVADYNELTARGGDEQSLAHLRLEKGLTEAAKGDTRTAMATLRQFIRDFPRDPRVSEAWVGLAELAFHSSPPKLDEARKDLAQALNATPTAAAKERADYLRIWLEEAAGEIDSKVIDLAKVFLQEHALSPFAAEVRMKLAELYYRRQDFANAQTQFELIAQQHPQGPFAEKALFFAAESAMSSMGEHSLDRALVLFDQVVQKNGSLRWAARNEQAAIERKLGKPRDALALYDEVLKSDAGPAEKREALCGKGDVYFELAAADPANYRLAIEAYDRLAAEPDEPSYWRNQALFKKALCLEKQGDRANALAVFYKVLETEATPGRQREFFWFYKAGFNAGRLLEEDSKWESAAAIYEKLAAAGGNRSEEAKARLNHLRLEHFLWTD